MPQPGDALPAGGCDRITIPPESIKSRVNRSIHPIHLSNINTDHVWTFVMKTRADEFVRFYPESLSLVLFGTYANKDHNDGGATPEIQAENHALRARSNLPQMFLNPTVMASGFIRGVEVLINGVKVGTNEGLNTCQQHYASAARIFNRKASPSTYLATNTDVESTSREDKKAPMTEACKPFDYVTWNAETGTRIPAYLDGVFPFDVRNKTRASMHKKDADAMYFPPETDFTIKFFLNNSKAQSIFHLGSSTMQEYFNDAHVGKDLATTRYKLTFQNVELSYESVVLKPQAHLTAASKLSKSVLNFTYDIPKIQYQTLFAGASYTENVFQISASADILYVLFLKSWQVQYMPARRKPVSSFSRFPENCTQMKLSFANEPSLIMNEMIDFGQKPTISQDITIYNYFKYLRERGFYAGTFDALFPSSSDQDSYIQALVADLSTLSSKRTDLLKIQCHFSGVNKSPAEYLILVMTVHPTGKAVCTKSTFWEFKEDA